MIQVQPAKQDTEIKDEQNEIHEVHILSRGATFFSWTTEEYLLSLKMRLWLTILLNCILMNIFTVGIILMKQDEKLETTFCRIVVGLHGAACLLQFVSLYRIWGKQIDFKTSRTLIISNALILGICFLIATPVIDLVLEEQSQYGCLPMILCLISNLFNVTSMDRRGMWFANLLFVILVMIHTQYNNWPLIKTVTAPIFVLLFTFIGDCLSNLKRQEKLNNIEKSAIIVVFIIIIQYISHWLWTQANIQNLPLLLVAQILCNRAIFRNIESGVVFTFISIGLLIYQLYIVCDKDTFGIEQEWQYYWYSIIIVSNVFQIISKTPKSIFKKQNKTTYQDTQHEV